MIVNKKEAHRMLSNIKVYVGGKSKEIQMKLFEAGFDWDYNEETRNLVGTCEDVPERYAQASYMYPVY